MVNGEIESRSEVHAAQSIRLHRENCLQYVRGRKSIYYPSALALAMDYGRNGTLKFFPLSQLAFVINADERFNAYVKKIGDNK